jgi:hypothetical protein
MMTGNPCLPRQAPRLVVALNQADGRVYRSSSAVLRPAALPKRTCKALS